MGGNLRALRGISWFLLSHHPRCSYFAGGTWTIAGRKVCIGCSIAYPSGTIALLTLWILPLPAGVILALGLGGLALQLLRLPLGKTPGPLPLKVFIKAAFGAGIVLGMAGALALPWPWTMLSLFLFLNALGAVYSLHWLRDLAICQRCPQFSLLPYCEGLGDLFKHLEVSAPGSRRDKVL